jgi:cobalt-zinc-cadmium efflux system protein
MKSQARLQSKSIIVGRVFLGLLFLYASIDKILHPGAFAEIVYNYHILPDGLIYVAAVVLPWSELVLGLFLVLDLWLLGAALVSSALLAVFLAAIAFNMGRGLDVSCGCFASATESVTPTTMFYYLIRDGLLLTLSLYVGCGVLLRKVDQ